MFKKFDFILVFVIGLGTLSFGVFQYNSSRLLTYLAVIPVLSAPYLVSKSKFKLGNKELCYYYLFVLLAYFLGCVVNLYKYIWWYDSFVHFISGIFSFGVGLYLVRRMHNVGINKWFLVFFCLCFVMFIAGIWEFFEFGVDNLLAMNLQHNKDTGVVDSMIDMLSAFVGGILSFISYLRWKR